MTASPGTGGRRLTPAQILLIVVVSALVLLFVVLLLTRPSDDGAPDAAPAPVTSTQPDAAPSATAEVSAAEGATPATDAEPEYFTSPSGNISCAITVDSADCVIGNFDYEPEDLGACEDEDEGAGGHLRVEPAGATMPCEPLVVAGDVPVLDYEESTTAHGYTCESARSGVTCRHDESGYGFTVARAAYELF